MSINYEGKMVRDAVFTGEIKLANFKDAELYNCAFNKVVMRGADFSGAQIKSCTFEDAVLTDARFKGTIMQSVCFNNAILKGVIFNFSKVKEGVSF